MPSPPHAYEHIDGPADVNHSASTAAARHSMFRALLPLVVVLSGLLLLAFAFNTQPTLTAVGSQSATATLTKRAWTLEPLHTTTASPHNPHLYLPPPPALLALHARLVPRATDAHPTRPPRLLVVGDIHGCLDELRALVTAAGIDPAQGDAVVATGDLVAKGPKSREVVQWLMQHGHFSVIGNHDQHVLKSAMLQGRLDGRRYSVDADIEVWTPELAAKADRNSDEYARTYYARMNGFTDEESSDYAHWSIARELSDDQLSWLTSLPISIDLSAAYPKEAGAAPWTVVHAGVVPDVPLEAQHPYHVTMIRNWVAATATPSNDTTTGDAWSMARPTGKGRALPAALVFGHDAGRGFQHPSADRLGLDTGASIGRYLTGLLLPDARVVSVPSAFVYFPPRSAALRPPPLPSGIPLADVPCVEPLNAHSAKPSVKAKLRL